MKPPLDEGEEEGGDTLHLKPHLYKGYIGEEIGLFSRVETGVSVLRWSIIHIVNLINHINKAYRITRRLLHMYSGTQAPLKILFT